MSINSVALTALVRIQLVAWFDTVFSAPFLRKQKIPVGEKWATGEAQIVGFDFRSNEKYPLVEYSTMVLHHLSDPTDSDTYCLGDMLTDMAYIMDPGNFDDIAHVIETREARLSTPPKRIGDVIEWESTMPFLLDAV